MKNIKILLTGGGGFIGSAFLVKSPQNLNIISLDFGDNYQKLKNKMNINIKFVKGDIKDEQLIDRIMEGVDIVIHLAGGGGNRACLENPVVAVTDNIIATRFLVKKAIQHKVKRFFFASTQSVYGTFAKREMPLTEDMTPKPDDFYATLKTAAELSIMDLFNNFVIFRFSNVYGYGSGLGSQWGGVIGKFIQFGCDNSEISVFGTGEQQIDFVNIDDVIQMMLKVINNDNIRNEIINVGCGRGIPIKEVGTTVAKVGLKNFNKTITINYKQAPQDKIWPDRWLSINKANELLDWHPKISLEEGIYQMMQKYIKEKTK